MSDLRKISKDEIESAMDSVDKFVNELIEHPTKCKKMAKMAIKEYLNFINNIIDGIMTLDLDRE